LSEEDGKMNPTKARVTEFDPPTVINGWETLRMTKNPRKEVLGIESAIPKIC
jgi:hypothetical protein